MDGATLRLRPHHCIDIYGYYMAGGREAYAKEWQMDRGKYGDSFVNGMTEMLERFWNGGYTRLQVVPASDDFCELCQKGCEGQNTSEDPTKDFRSLGLVIGEYDAEEIRAKVRQRDQNMRRRDLLPM
jgi:hypothetical protein